MTTIAALGALAAPAFAGGGNKVTPFVECAFDNGDGTYDVAYGYDNANGSSVTAAVGPNNFFSPAPQDRGQPTVFTVGTQDNAWVVSGVGMDASWTLHGQAATLTASTPPCASASLAVASGAWAASASMVLAVFALVVVNRPRNRRIGARL
jgi:hypothetical protein